MLFNVIIKKECFNWQSQQIQPAGDTITLHIDKVVADNPKQFLNDLDMYVRMNKS